MKINLQPIKGFRDLYPTDKAIQNFIFEKLKNVANLFGFENYDGPLLESLELYLNKTSKELVEKQTFLVKDKNEKTFVMRPEMTPSLARIVAAKEQTQIYPLKLFNLGLRFRYEAPQKGREREFYQGDFDILGEKNILQDAEILTTAVSIFKNFGATEKDFVLYINSREFIQQKLEEIKISKNIQKEIISIIDKKDKIKPEIFEKLILDQGVSREIFEKLIKLLKTDFSKEAYFEELFKLLRFFGVEKYIKINPNIVRGLDYYTGLVFEVKEIGSMNRSLLGGGRYDNLLETTGASKKIPGIGFATSDVVIWEFLKDKNLIPDLLSKKTKFLITVFNTDTLEDSIKLATFFRKNNISCEVFLNPEKKIDKQIKYADKNKIPFVVILGPEEIKKRIIKVKNMKNGEQKEVSIDNLTTSLC